MGEIKSVKVDNWGVFFLQKLQNFFNKTDYCDLTLQFRDNSQLKVHRLVLSACTDYFNVLEQTCEVVDDAIIMPNGLQADVVVPIVNFMYTGTLEFELKMYNRLLRTAKDMNMTVLLKLLEAHRRTMEMHPQKASGQASPKPRRRTPALATSTNSPSNASGRSLIQTNQGKRIVVGSNVNAPQNRSVSTGNTSTRLQTAGPLPVRQIGSTTFTRIKVENELQETNTPTSASSGHSLIKQSPQQQQPTSPFEQLRKGYNNNKRPAVSTFISPPAKKPNLEDVKEFAEQQRMRKQIAAEYGDDDYDASNIMDDDAINNDDDDDEMLTSTGQTQTTQTPATSTSAGVQTVASSSSQQQHTEDPPGTTTIIVKHEGPDKPPTIVVKDNSNSKMNHAKIISEVLRQYPHLVKSNKNIKLKIMPNTGGQAQKIIVKKESMETDKQTPTNKLTNTAKVSDSQQSMKTLATNIANRPKSMQQQHTEISVSGKLNSGGAQMAATKTTSTAVSTTASTQSATGQPQKRRIDSKTMHALIALGAENTTGPWLCLRCGRNGHPISIPSYRGFRRHLINTHKEIIDPALCEHCGWRSGSKRELHFHMQLEHKVKTNLYIFPECQLCQQMCIDSDGLNQHLIDSHPDENKQQCIYCNKIFPEEIQLYTHMKTFHKKQALEDGIIDYSDDEAQLPPLPPIEYDKEDDQEEKELQQAKKIKILSDISLPIASSIIKTDTTFAQQQESTISAVSEEYLQDQDQENNETKFVAADGSEVILTAEQRKEILSQLNQEHEGTGVVMVLNENQQTHLDQGTISQDETSQATTATNEERERGDEEEQLAEDDQHDDNQIYNEMKSLHSNLDEVAAEVTNDETSLHEEDQEQEDAQVGTEHERAEQLEESKESIDNLEWAENLISEHELADEASSQNVNDNAQINKPEEKEMELNDHDKSQDEISKKLKELTGDWSEDDDEDDIPEESQKELAEISKIQVSVKERETTSPTAHVMTSDEESGGIKKLSTEQEIASKLDDHADLLASLQSVDKDEKDKEKQGVETIVEESENIDEDDIDIALKSLHKEDIEGEKTNVEKIEEEEKLSKDVSNKRGLKSSCDLEKKTVNDLAEITAKNEKQDRLDSAVATDISAKEEKPEEKLVKEIEAIDKAELPSSTMDVNEETKKDLIQSLLSEQAETMEDTATETLSTTGITKSELKSSLHDEQDKVDADVKPIEEKSNTDDAKVELIVKEEFLSSPIKLNAANNEGPITTTDISSTSEPASSTGKTEAINSLSTSVKEETTLSSEDRVKSLISEWGDDDDDDDDEDDNDRELTANL